MPFFIDRVGDFSILEEELYFDLLEEELLNNELLNGGFVFDEERGVFEARRPVFKGVTEDAEDIECVDDVSIFMY